MKQPVSRNSFDRQRGYLGVYLQEGAPFVDAFWNEGAELQRSLLRDAIRDAGLEGTAGIELRIDPIIEDGPGLVGLVARGGEGRFYCGGLPVLWPESQWLEVPSLEAPRAIYLEAQVELVDSLDLPDLDDPGLGLERGSFRARVQPRLVVGGLDEPFPGEPSSNLRLTIRGSYGADLNVRYRVELVKVEGERASLLWDSAAASVTALVTARAAAGAAEVKLGSTEGFEVGHLVRFEGRGLRERLYRVTARTADSLTVEGHQCHAVSLIDCAGELLKEEGAALHLLVEDTRRADSPLAALAAGDLVKKLPVNLRRPGSLQDERFRSERGWLVAQAVAIHPAPGQGDEPGDQGRDEGRRRLRLELVPNGLADELDPWDGERASSLALAAHPFHTCIEVRTPADRAQLQHWTAGMRIRLPAAPPAPRGTELHFTDSEAGRCCQPGDDDEVADEVRRVVRVIFHRRGACGEGQGPTMTLVLDEALSYEHVAGAEVVPERPIRARRYEGHACEVPIDRIDPGFAPAPASPTSPYDLAGRLPLVPSGLSLLLSVEGPAGKVAPVGLPGDGWTFAARAGGWVERPVFAPVDEVPRARVKLAELERRKDGGLAVVDVRPVPAPHAHHGWLADLADTAGELAELVPSVHAERVAELARRAGGQRAQRELVPALGQLAGRLRDWAQREAPRMIARCRALQEAVDAVVHRDRPSAPELSRLASVMERLTCAVAVADAAPPPPEPRRAPAPAGEAPAPAGGAQVTALALVEPSVTALALIEPSVTALALVEPSVTALSLSEPPRSEPSTVTPSTVTPSTVTPSPVAPPIAAPPLAAPPSIIASAPSPAALASLPAAPPRLDLAALPTRLVEAPRGSPPPQRKKWPLLRDVPAPRELSRGPARRLAEVVAVLLEQSAALGGRALAGEDRGALQAALDALWKSRFAVAQLAQPIHLDDAIALHGARGAGGKP